jgi:tetratricopeptide (TPR) repeat protein
VNRLALGLASLLLPSVALAQTSADLDAQGDAKKAQRDFAGAQADYTQALAANPKDVRACIARGTVCAKLGDNAGAIADDTAALALDPKNAIALSNRGNARAAARDFSGAVSDYTQALALDPGHVAAYLNRANVEAMQRNYAAALPDYNAALALDPKNALALYDRAGARRAVGHYADAAADYSQVLLQNPSDVRARLNRAVVRMAQRKWNAAAPDLQECLKTLPPAQQIYPRLYLWVVGVKEGREPQATRDIKDYREQIRHLPWTPSSQFATFLAGDMQDWQLTAHVVSPTFPDAKNHEAKANFFAAMRREASHDPVDARTLFEKCINLGDPKLHEVILAREELKQMGPH